MAKTVNFEIIQGDTFVLNATYKDADKNPIDLSTFGITFEVRDDFGGSVVCATATKNNGITLNNTTKAITITMTPEQTKRFTVPKASYQLQITSNNGTKTTLASGYFAVGKAVIS
jgi:hypothetical protein